MKSPPLTVAWFSFFPIEWLRDIPPRLANLPRQHPASWQRVLLDQLEGNPNIRLHVIILRKHFERSESFERNGVIFHLVKTMGGTRAPSFFWLDTWLIRRVLKRIQPDVIHAWGTESGAALVASRLGYPSVVTMQGLLTWLAKVVPLNSYHRFSAFLEDFSLRRAKLVTAESSFALRYLKERHPGLNIHQVEHSPLPLFHKVQRSPLTQPFQFLFVGGFTFLKGVDVMLRALDQLKSTIAFELVVVGHAEPSDIAGVKAQVSEEVWNRVIFRGSLTAEGIAAELETASLFLYPTRCDNSPNAVKEAVVAGVPVVASAIGGVVDYVIPGKNGVLFRSDDVSDCKRAIKEALEHPLFSCGLVEPSVLNEMRSYLSAETMASRFMEMYRFAAASSTAAPTETLSKNLPDSRLS